MSDVSQGPGWWQASDRKWYPPEAVPGTVRPPPPATVPAGPYMAPGTLPPGVMPPGSMPRPQGTNGMAIASLVLSIIWMWGLGSILAIIFGFSARRQIRQTRGAQGGDGLAIAGIVIGIVGVLGTVAISIALFAVSNAIKHGDLGPGFGTIAGETQVEASCLENAKVMETALEAYKAEDGTFPPAGNGLALTQPSTSPTGQAVGPFLRVLPPTTNYTIWTDGNGGVYVYPASQTTTPTSFASEYNFNTGSPCEFVTS